MKRSTKGTLWAVLGVVLAVGILLLWRSAGPTPAESGEGGRIEPATGGSARAGGFAEMGAPADAATDAGAAPCSITGTLVDDQDLPVADGRVTLRPHAARRLWRRVEPLAVAADGTGAFGFSAVACGTFIVAANAPGRVASHAERVTVDDDTPTAQLQLVLGREGYRVSGSVNDEGGGGIAAATIRAVQMPQGSAHETRADDQGRFALLLRSGTYWLAASASGYAEKRRRLAVNRDRELSFALEPAGTIRGRVLLRNTGDPVAGANVSASRGWRPWAGPLATTSAADGTFELTGLAAGEYDVRASLGRLRGEAPGHVPVGVASYVADVTIGLRAGVAIRGRVVDGDGAGVAGARLEWMAFAGEPAETTSREEGRFELVGLAPGRGMVIAAKRGYARGSDMVNLGGEDETDVEVEILSGVTLRGRVLDRERQPMAGVAVTAMPEARGGFGPMRMMGAAMDASDGEGRFLLEGLAPGDVVVRAQDLESGYATSTLEDLEAGRTYEVELVIERGASLAGTVTWEDGAVAAGATVHARGRGMGPLGGLEAEADASGAYTLAGLEPRRYRVWAARPSSASPFPLPSAGAAERQVELAPDQALVGVDFVLARADLTISGQVRDESGSPVADAEVGASLERGSFSPRHFLTRHLAGGSARSAADGSFTVTELTRGTHDVWAELPGFPRASSDGIEAGATGVILTIPPGASLAGAVVGATGAPVTPYELRTIPVTETTGWMRWHGSDRLTVEEDDGAFEVRGLAAGTYRLVATTAAGGVGELAAVEVELGQRRDGLRIELAAGASLRCSLRGHASGEPVAGAGVIVLTDAGHQPAATDEQGELEVEGLAPGDGTLVVRPDAERYLFDRFGVTIEPGENVVELRVVELAALSAERALPPVQLVPAGSQIAVAAPAASDASPFASGDQLATIDGQAVTGLGIRGAEALMRGPAGSEVRIGLVAAASGEGYGVTLTRVADESVVQP